MFTAAITVSNKISICNTQIVILYKNNLRPRSSIGTATSWTNPHILWKHSAFEFAGATNWHRILNKNRHKCVYKLKAYQSLEVALDAWSAVHMQIQYLREVWAPRDPPSDVSVPLDPPSGGRAPLALLSEVRAPPVPQTEARAPPKEVRTPPVPQNWGEGSS